MNTGSSPFSTVVFLVLIFIGCGLLLYYAVDLHNEKDALAAQLSETMQILDTTEKNYQGALEENKTLSDTLSTVQSENQQLRDQLSQVQKLLGDQQTANLTLAQEIKNLKTELESANKPSSQDGLSLSTAPSTENGEGSSSNGDPKESGELATLLPIGLAVTLLGGSLDF